MFKAGDVVEITEVSDETGMLDFKKGKGYIVANVAGGMVRLSNESGRDGWYSRNHFKLKEDVMDDTTEKKECMFKKGQVVWDIINGKGVVENYYHYNQPYPVKVVFEDGDYNFYTDEGKLEVEDKSRRLFFSEPKIEASTEPVFEPVLKSGDVVIAVDNNGEHAALVVTVTEEDEHFVKTVEYGVMGKQRWDFYRLGERIVFN